jgi:hypothetical protein
VITAKRFCSPGYLNQAKAALQRSKTSTGDIEAFEKGLLAYQKEHIFPNFDKLEFYYSLSKQDDGCL